MQGDDWMGFAGRKGQRIALLAVAGFLAATSVESQFTPFNDRSRAILEGNWQSCREADGEYSERVYDGKWPGIPPFELHLGPRHEFAMFDGVQDAHRDHNSSANLLNPYTVEVRGNKATRKWDAAGVRLEVALAGGSREECESWYIRLTPATSSSH